MKRPPVSANLESKAAGVSGGTGFAGVVLLLPDGYWKSILLILAPTITVVISSFWYVVTDEVNGRVADWRIRNQKKRAEELLRTLSANPNASAALKAQAKKNLDALTLLEVEISKKRVAAIIAS